MLSKGEAQERHAKTIVSCGDKALLMTRGGIVMPDKQVISNLESYKIEEQLYADISSRASNRKLMRRNTGVLTHFYTNVMIGGGRLEDKEQEPRKQ